METYESLESKEWLITNGLGGYASASVAGSNTRRYHGLLVAARNPPTDRQVLVSKIEETLIGQQRTFELSSNRYGEIIHPQGWQHILTFEQLPLPCWTYRAGGHQLTKTVCMVQGSNTTVLAYHNPGPQAITLRLNPLFVCRDYHSLYHRHSAENYYVEPIAGSKTSQRLKLYAHYGADPLYMALSAGTFVDNRAWYNRFTYRHERERGLDFVEDAYSVGHFNCELAAGSTLFLTFSTDEAFLSADPATLITAEVERVNSLKKPQADPFLQDLTISANQFIVQRKSTGTPTAPGETIIAGYHWFTDWGRDTMIALRGLCISLGHQQTAKQILETFFRYLDDGMLPNRFPDNSHDPVEYNTIDATLWLFVALYEYHQRFTDLPFIESHFEHLLAILDAHRDGTRYGIHVTEEGLLYGGKGTAQLTWMDARVGDYVVTPRHGCPVEINALWYNALKITIAFAKELGRKPDMYAMLLRRFEENFRTHFWNNNGYLNDVVMPGSLPDASIRPNQIYALSLPFPLLKLEEQKQVLATVTKHLYTPYGLRTLAPSDPHFAAVYGGDQWLRDTAYHQGTVWPFLLGEYWSAYLRLNKFSAQARTTMHTELATLKSHFYEHDCLFGISEIFDGLNPGDGRGTANQAWSVAALIKLLTDFPR